MVVKPTKHRVIVMLLPLLSTFPAGRGLFSLVFCLRASSPILASEASLARTRERRSLAQVGELARRLPCIGQAGGKWTLFHPPPKTRDKTSVLAGNSLGSRILHSTYLGAIKQHFSLELWLTPSPLKERCTTISFNVNLRLETVHQLITELTVVVFVSDLIKAFAGNKLDTVLGTLLNHFLPYLPFIPRGVASHFLLLIPSWSISRKGGRGGRGRGGVTYKHSSFLIKNSVSDKGHTVIVSIWEEYLTVL